MISNHSLMENNHSSRQTIHRILVLNIILLVYAGLSFFTLKVPTMEEPALVPQIPSVIGDWIGKDLPLEDGEVDRDGAISTVRKVYEKKKESVGVLVIREGLGKRGIHSPVNCFTANGWTVNDNYSDECLIPELNRIFRFQVIRLSQGKEHIVSFYTIFYDGVSYDSFLEFMAVRFFKTLLGTQKPACLLRFTTKLAFPESDLYKPLIKQFSESFIPAAFSNSLEVRVQIDPTRAANSEVDGTNIAK
jgi:hypothetical protein